MNSLLRGRGYTNSIAENHHNVVTNLFTGDTNVNRTECRGAAASITKQIVDSNLDQISAKSLYSRKICIC